MPPHVSRPQARLRAYSTRYESGPFQTPAFVTVPAQGRDKQAQARAKRERIAAPQRRRRSASCSIAIRAAGVTTSVNTVANARPNTTAGGGRTTHSAHG